METRFEGRHSGISWYDWSYQFQLKMTLVHLWPFYKGDITPPISGGRAHEAEFAHLSLMGFAVLNVCVSDQIQQAIRTCRDEPEPAKKAWAYMLATFQAQDSTNQILLADQLTRFKQRPNEDLEVYINRLRALRSQLEGVNTPITEISFCMYLIKGLTSEWEYLKQYFTLSPIVSEASLVHALTTAQRSRNEEFQRRGFRNQALQVQADKRPPPFNKKFGGGQRKGWKPKPPERKPFTSDNSLLICYSRKQA